jgi:predicted CDP-diglyceride synthetase/phosphatidate cytidylyltransferase
MSVFSAGALDGNVLSSLRKFKSTLSVLHSRHTAPPLTAIVTFLVLPLSSLPVEVVCVEFSTGILHIEVAKLILLSILNVLVSNLSITS